jgi:hypothetical protein
MSDIKAFLYSKLNDQDFMQKVNVSVTVCFELYRSIISSFLILFVPQKCDDHLCTLNENLSLENPLYSAGIVSNFLTMFLLCALYYLEVKRENKLISYLEVNKNKAFDNKSVGEALINISDNRRNSIYFIDKCYQVGSYVTITCFAMNATLSGIVIYNYYLDDRTTTTYVTNLLFMILKLVDVQNTVNSEKNIFYSAYLKTKVQYNDIDPDKVNEILDNTEIVDEIETVDNIEILDNANIVDQIELVDNIETLDNTGIVDQIDMVDTDEDLDSNVLVDIV